MKSRMVDDTTKKAIEHLDLEKKLYEGLKKRKKTSSVRKVLNVADESAEKQTKKILLDMRKLKAHPPTLQQMISVVSHGSPKAIVRTNTIELKPTKQQGRILKEMLTRSSAIWNLGNYIKRKGFFVWRKTNKKKKMPTYNKLAKDLKTHQLYKALGSAYSQQILRKLEGAWSSYFGLKGSPKLSQEEKNKVKIPGYFKNRRTNQTLPKLLVCRNDQYEIDEHFIYITCSKDLKRKYGIKKSLRICYHGIRKWKGIQKQMEIKYVPFLKKFYAYQVVETESTPIYTKPENITSGDIGIKRYLVNYIKNAKDFVVLYPSEHVFEEYKAISERIYRLQRIAKRENERHSTKRINKLYIKRKRKLNNYMNNIIANLFKELVKYQVSKLIVGDLTHIRDAELPVYYRNKKKLNTMIHNFWSYGLLIEKLRNKSEEFGIEFEQINERGTSSTCPDCGAKVRPSGRRFNCKICGYKQDRDVVGCINILRKYYDVNDINRRVENHPMVSPVLIEQ